MWGLEHCDAQWTLALVQASRGLLEEVVGAQPGTVGSPQLLTRSARRVFCWDRLVAVLRSPGTLFGIDSKRDFYEALPLDATCPNIIFAAASTAPKVLLKIYASIVPYDPSRVRYNGPWLLNVERTVASSDS